MPPVSPSTAARSASYPTATVQPRLLARSAIVPRPVVTSISWRTVHPSSLVSPDRDTCCDVPVASTLPCSSTMAIVPAGWPPPPSSPPPPPSPTPPPPCGCSGCCCCDQSYQRSSSASVESSA